MIITLNSLEIKDLLTILKKRKSIFTLLLTICLVACESEIKKEENLSNLQKDELNSDVDFHELMDLVLNQFAGNYRDKILYMEYKPIEKPIPERFKSFILHKQELSEDEKSLAIQLIENGGKAFEFDQENLNKESRLILSNSEKEVDENVTYDFNSFLGNKNGDMVISTLGVFLNNESYNGKTAGEELIVFFKKENGEWKISNHFTTIEY
jgi:hypothetical protein